MRVLHLCKTFSALSETFIYDYITELEHQHVENHVVTLNHVNEAQRPFSRVKTIAPYSHFNPLCMWHRLRMFATGADPLSSHWTTLRSHLKQELRDNPIDLIHAHFGPMGVLVAPIARELKTPLVTSFLGHDISVLPLLPFWSDSYKQLFNENGSFIGISSHICNKLLSLGAPPNRVKLLHLGVNLERFQYTNPSNRFDGSNITCIHVGRLVPKKSPLMLIEAFTIARTRLKDRCNLRLTIIGDGSLKKAVVEKIRLLGASAHIELLGALSNDEVYQQLAKSHIYVQHCITAPDGDEEGLGVSFIEASATGLPIVTTRHNGIPDVVLHEETGFLVNEGDVMAMADKICYLAQRPNLWSKLGNAGRAHVEDNFRIESQAMKLKHFYNTLLSPPN